VKDLGEYASDQELVAMINEFDKDKDGQSKLFVLFIFYSQ
jgi:Ca2+-binding EF-hand superfamily protein